MVVTCKYIIIVYNKIIQSFRTKMMEFLLLILFMFMAFVGYQQVYPFARKYMSYKREREELVIRYNRVYRSRKDMLVSFFAIVQI